MNSKIDDTTTIPQIEENLHYMNQNLFHDGNLSETNQLIPRKDATQLRPDKTKVTKQDAENLPLVSNDYINEAPMISRAEYIRQARESCLRQLSNVQLYSKPYDINYMEPDIPSEQLSDKNSHAMNLFHNAPENHTLTKNPEQQLASFRSILIRSVCAIILFLSIFALDKFHVKAGNVSNQVIKEYVTGNDALKDLENIIVGWLK